MISTNVKKNDENFDVENNNKNQFNKFQKKKSSMIVNVDRHVFYRNVYNFIDKLKELKQNFFEFKIKKFVSSCLRDEILIWHSIEFIEFEKNLFKNVNVDQWINVLFNRFKNVFSLLWKFYKFNVMSWLIVEMTKHFVNTYKTSCVTLKSSNSLLFSINSFWRETILILIFECKFRNLRSLQSWKFFSNNLISKRRFDTKWLSNVLTSTIMSILSTMSTNLINKSISKNRKRQNDFFQQFDVNDFFFFFLLIVIRLYVYQFKKKFY